MSKQITVNPIKGKALVCGDRIAYLCFSPGPDIDITSLPYQGEVDVIVIPLGQYRRLKALDRKVKGKRNG